MKKIRPSFIGVYILFSLLCVIACIVCIILKIANVVDISWWMVFSPIWFPYIVSFVCFSVAIGFITLKDSFKNIKYISKDVYD